MMKKIVLGIIFLGCVYTSFANHLKGGWIQYEYLSTDSSAKTNKYKITVRQYLLCSSSGGQIDQQIYVGIFDGANSSLFTTVTINLSNNTEFPTKTTYDPCLTPKPTICYRIDSYVTTVDLPFNFGGYSLSVQRCCRIGGIQNVSNSSTVGISYTAYIPSTIGGINYSKNSSPSFVQRDTAVVCYNSYFTFDFSATDADGDSLVYNFCDGLTGGGTGAGQQQPNPPTNPPYSGIPYSSGYSGTSPLGSKVSIDQSTGLISGIAPNATGDYVVAVCVSEFRGGVLISITKKEIHINIANCSISAATLKPSYITCNGFTLNFQNESTSSNISSYAWKFGDVKNPLKDTSYNPTPTYTYKDTGTFTMKLVVVGAGGCKDSANATVRVYPGFVPGFKVTGSCIQNPYLFTDTTYTRYGTVNSWSWTFDDATSGTADTSSTKNPSHVYTATGIKNIKFVVSNSKGCMDSLIKAVTIKDKPSLQLPFHDTLICSIDTLPLIANISSGTVSWTPTTARIINPTNTNPLVYPTDTTTYYVTLTDNGCIANDSIKVNVLKFISVDAGLDTGICKTDTIRLRPVSDALSYKWIASSGVFVDSVKYPYVSPLLTTKYYVVANLGKCQANDSVTVRVAPYPQVAVSPDTTICFGTKVQLQSSIVGTIFQWLPSNTLQNANTLNPIAGPVKTTAYILTVNDNVGCPKPVSDTVVVTVIPPIKVFAGRDTAVVANQPLQLNAYWVDSVNYSFVWTPNIGLNNPFIKNPIATLPVTIDSIRYIVTASLNSTTCYGTDDIWVKVYKTEPDIFVPSAFTPNSDGRNDIIKPIPIGISTLEYFRVYNRWGQLLYATSEIGQGWDGKVNGTQQQSGTYVYATQGIDYTGKIVFRKGTIVLIR
jgi:gliding motility-associated-like protein